VCSHPDYAEQKGRGRGSLRGDPQRRGTNTAPGPDKYAFRVPHRTSSRTKRMKRNNNKIEKQQQTTTTKQQAQEQEQYQQ
jgi:hypothetical protein